MQVKMSDNVKPTQQLQRNTNISKTCTATEAEFRHHLCRHAMYGMACRRLDRTQANQLYVQTHGTAVGNSVVILHHMMEQWFQFHVLTGYGNYEIRTMIVTYVQV